MIEQTVKDLTTIIATRPTCRASLDPQRLAALGT
jgi:hypothetical protein